MKLKYGLLLLAVFAGVIVFFVSLNTNLEQQAVPAQSPSDSTEFSHSELNQLAPQFDDSQSVNGELRVEDYQEGSPDATANSNADEPTKVLETPDAGPVEPSDADVDANPEAAEASETE